MESLSRPPHRRKHSTSSSSSSFSLKNPYDGVSMARGGKAKFEPREYAEIFSGSSSIPVLDISGLNEPARPGGCRSSELDYSNIFGGARGDDVAVSYEQLFNGVPKKTKNRISADAESPYQERGSLNSSGKATRVDGVSVDGTTPLLNMSFNKTNQAISNESNGKTHIAQLHAVSGFTHFVDGTPQLQKKGGERPVVSMKRDVSRTWSFRSGIGATTVNGGLSPENSYTPDNSCKTNGVNVKLHISELRPTSGHLSGSNDNKDINHSGLPSFSYKDASKETAGEHSPPLSDEELDENSDAAVSIAALRKAIEQAQESIRLAKMIVQKKREGIVDGSRAKRSKNRSEVEGKKKNRIEHASSGSLTENSDPTFSVFTRTVGKSAPILGHSGEHVNASTAKTETVRENIEEAKDHGSAFIDVDKKCAASSSESESLSTDKKIIEEDIRQNIGAFEPHAERLNFSGSVETVALEAGRKVDSNDNLARSKATAVPCLEHIETDQDTLEQTESIMHQQEGHKDFFARQENVVNTSSCVQELEQSPNEETEESCQETVSPIEGLADIGEQLERVLGVSRSSLEQEKITHGGERLWISKENEPEDSDSIDDKEKCEQKCVANEELYLDKHVTMPRSNFDTSQNKSPRLAETKMVDVADIDKQHENVSEWIEDGQDGKCSDTNENGMSAKEEILWFESELQLEESAEEEISERGPEIYPEVREVATKVDVVLEPKIDDKKLNFELENNSQTVHGEHEENEIALGCMNAAETIQILENNDSEVPSSEFSSDFEELNDTDEAAGRMTGLQDNIEELNDSASEKDSSESFGVHFNDPSTIFRDGHGINTRNISSETLEPCNDDLTNEAEKCQAVLRVCEENKSLPQETERFLAVEVDKTGKGFALELNNMPGTDAEKFTKSQLNNTFEEFGDSNFTSIPPMSADNEKILPNDEKFCSTTEFHSSAVEYSTNTSMHNFPEPHVSTDDQVKKCDSTNEKQDRVQASEDSEESQSSSTIESIDEASAHESPDCSNVAKDISSDTEEVKGQQNERTNTEDQSHISQTNCKPKEMYKSVEAERDIETGQNTENNMQNLSRASTSEQKDAKGNEQKCEIDDHLQRIEAIKKGREREKDRITVERVIREARERAFADARERAERASVERAAAEARQRVVGEKTMKKAPTETKPSIADKASMEAKLRAERAAVERATTEARERALEKAMSQKTSVGARVSSSSRNIGLKHSSSDPKKLDANSESTQRRKARLERHQRIMERAAKALAEKNMRDLLVQKEQTERSRLAEPLDAEIKRWATGKEGNLRALLSTLQYILGPESGWQPIPLTEIVTTAAVRKSYRKATLCVHPDKLQQRGASIQQKYICEKIFYLLKAAWNRFNSEEN